MALDTSSPSKTRPSVEDLVLEAQSCKSGNRLIQLSASLHVPVRQAVAANKLTPQSVLSFLAKDPAFEVRATVAAREDLADEWTLRLTQDDMAQVRQAIANRKFLTEKVSLILSSDPAVAPYMARRKHLPVEAFNRLMRSGHPEVRAALAQHDLCPGEDLMAMASDPETIVRYHVATNPKTPGMALVNLAADEDPDIRMAAIRHPNLWPETLEDRVADPSATVRELIASHPMATRGVLSKLAYDASVQVRLKVAVHANTPPSVLSQLARDANSAVRGAIARRPDGPLHYLANDPDAGIRRTVASNPATPAEQLHQLIKDREPSVRLAAFNNPALDMEVVIERIQAGDKALQPAIRQLVQAKAHPLPMLKALAQAVKDDESRLYLLLQPHADRDLIDHLLQFPYPAPMLQHAALYGDGHLLIGLARQFPALHGCLARNPRTPIAALLVMASEASDDELREALLNHPQADDDLITLLLAQPLHDETLIRMAKGSHVKVLARLADRDRRTHGLLVANRHAPAAALLAIASDPNSDTTVRFLTAFHPNCTPEVAAALSYSGNMGLVYAAAKCGKLAPDLKQALAESTNDHVARAAKGHKPLLSWFADRALKELLVREGIQPDQLTARKVPFLPSA